MHLHLWAIHEIPSQSFVWRVLRMFTYVLFTKPLRSLSCVHFHCRAIHKIPSQPFVWEDLGDEVVSWLLGQLVSWLVSHLVIWLRVRQDLGNEIDGAALEQHDLPAHIIGERRGPVMRRRPHRLPRGAVSARHSISNRPCFVRGVFPYHARV
jgi:hypothetical protein